MANIINKEKLTTGIIFGDLDNEEYIYMPGGEIGSYFPACVFEHRGVREELSLEEAATMINKMHLKQLNLIPFSKI